MKQPLSRRTTLESGKHRARRRRKWIALVLGVISLPTLAFSALVYISHLKVIQIETFSVIGAKTVSSSSLTDIAEQIMFRPYAHFFSRDNILFYPKAEVVAALASSSPRIDAVMVKTSGLRGLTIYIHERTPVALWCDSVSCENVDDSGLLYEKAATSSLIIFNGYTENNRIPYMSNALALIAGLSVNGFDATTVAVNSDADIEVQTKQGILLKISLEDDPAKTVDYLHTFVNNLNFKEEIKTQSIAYIDLRFGNKVYYLPTNNAKHLDSTSTKIQAGQ